MRIGVHTETVVKKSKLIKFFFVCLFFVLALFPKCRILKLATEGHNSNASSFVCKGTVLVFSLTSSSVDVLHVMLLKLSVSLGKGDSKEPSWNELFKF